MTIPALSLAKAADGTPVEMPLLGFGTWQIRGAAAYEAVREALEAGYRHLDTATMYGNEAEVGRALRESGVARDDVFVTTKCPPNHVGRELQTLQQSLDALGTDHRQCLVRKPERRRNSVHRGATSPRDGCSRVAERYLHNPAETRLGDTTDLGHLHLG